MPDLSQPWDTFLCQLGKPAAPGLAQLSSSLLQTPLSALPGWCDYRGEIRTGSVCVTSQGHLPVSVSCLDSKPSQTLTARQCLALALLGVAWGRAGMCQLPGTSLPMALGRAQRGPWDLSPAGAEPLGSTATP